MIENLEELIDFASTLPTKTIGVIYPSNQETFSALSESVTRLKVSFKLFGQKESIEKGMKEFYGTHPEMEIIDHASRESALSAAIAAACDGEADILMKGGIDTGTMMKAVLSGGNGREGNSSLRTGRLLSDVFVFEYPKRKGSQLVMITDGGMTLAPDLKNKVELVTNAVDVAHALRNANPKVAILSATEFVLTNLQSTIDAAALSKMNERGQIQGCVVDGPLALDSALSENAAEEKGIKSEVAGRAEVLVAPNIEAANSLAKSTTYFANLRLAHVIVGARIPILIPSRADKKDAKLLSVALGCIVAEYSKKSDGVEAFKS